MTTRMIIPFQFWRAELSFGEQESILNTIELYSKQLSYYKNLSLNRLKKKFWSNEAPSL